MQIRKKHPPLEDAWEERCRRVAEVAKLRATASAMEQEAGMDYLEAVLNVSPVAVIDWNDGSFVIAGETEPKAH